MLLTGSKKSIIYEFTEGMAEWIDKDPSRIFTDGVEGVQRNPLL